MKRRTFVARANTFGFFGEWQGMNEKLTAGDICTREVIVAFRTTSLIEAAQLMREYHVGSLVVVDETGGLRHVVGMLTDRDIVTAVVAPALEPGALSVGDVMSAEPITAQDDDSVFDLLSTMRDKGLRRLPVVGREHELIGLVTLDDVLEIVAQELDLLVSAIGSGARLERKRRS